MAGISINVIRVGSDQFTSADLTTIDSAIAVLRNTYATVGLTLRRVEQYDITTAQANGRDILDNSGEAETLKDSGQPVYIGDGSVTREEPEFELRSAQAPGIVSIAARIRFTARDVEIIGVSDWRAAPALIPERVEAPAT